jgi:lysophospholipase L1-like esterase
MPQARKVPAVALGNRSPFRRGPYPRPTDLSGLLLWHDADRGLWDATSGGNSVGQDDAQIARWDDQSSNGYHSTQSTSANRPRYDAIRRAVCSCLGPSATSPQQNLVPSGSLSFGGQAFSAFWVIAPTSSKGNGGSFQALSQSAGTNWNVCLPSGGANATALSVYNGSFVSTGAIPYAGQFQLLGIVGTAANLIGWVNRTKTTGTALSSGSIQPTAFLGFAGQYPCDSSVRDIIIYNRALSDGEVRNVLYPYSLTRGVPIDSAGLLACDGDSITAGVGAALNRGWPQYLNLPFGVRRRVTAQSGIGIATASSNAATSLDPLLVSGQRNVLAIWIGTNDISIGTSGSSIYSSLTSYITARRSAGWDKIAVFTTIKRSSFSGSTETQRQAYNSAIVGNAAGADAVIDVASLAEFGDPANTTYVFDGIHPTAAGYRATAALANQPLNLLFA